MLAPGTTYDFRLVASNADGTTYGPNRTFTTLAPVTLALTRGHGPGVGGVAVTPGPTNTLNSACRPACSFDLFTETPYTLAAEPYPGFAFAGWSGGGCAGTGTCRLTLIGNTSIAASFVLNPPHLSRVSFSRHRPKLSFTVAAGHDDLLEALKVTLPKNLRLATAKHGIKLSVHGARLAIRHGTLTIKFPRAEPNAARVTLSGRAIRLIKHSHGRPELVVSATTIVNRIEQTFGLSQRT